MKKYILILFLAFFSAMFTFAQNVLGSPMPQGSSTVVDNFEEGYVWVFGAEGSVSSGAELARKWKSEGKYSLKISSAPNNNGSNALWFTEYVEGDYLDISEFNYIAIDVKYPCSEPLVIGLCFLSDVWEWGQGEEWIWFPEGEYTLVYDIRNVPKSVTTKVRRIMLMQVMATNSDIHLYIDNIRGYK